MLQAVQVHLPGEGAQHKHAHAVRLSISVIRTHVGSHEYLWRHQTFRELTQSVQNNKNEFHSFISKLLLFSSLSNSFPVWIFFLFSWADKAKSLHSTLHSPEHVSKLWLETILKLGQRFGLNQLTSLFPISKFCSWRSRLSLSRFSKKQTHSWPAVWHQECPPR